TLPLQGDRHVVPAGDRDPAVLLLHVAGGHRVPAAADQDAAAIHELQPVLAVRGLVDAAGQAACFLAVDGGEDRAAPLVRGLAEALRLGGRLGGPAPDRLAR